MTEQARKRALKGLEFLVDMANEAVHHHMQHGSVERAEADVKAALTLLNSEAKPKETLKDKLIAIGEKAHRRGMDYAGEKPQTPDDVREAVIYFDDFWTKTVSPCFPSTVIFVKILIREVESKYK